MSYDPYRDDPEVQMVQAIRKEREEAEKLLKEINTQCGNLYQLLEQIKGGIYESTR